MGILRQLFGPSKKEVWQQLCHDIDGQLVEGGFFGRDQVVARAGEWPVTLDTHTVSTGESNVTYTRLRAPYVNRDGFRFEIYRKGLFSGLGKALGMQDVEVGHARFDDEFIIKGNDERKLRQLFDHQRIRALIEAQPKFHLCVKDDEGWFGTHFPQGVDELHFQVIGVIRDVERLKSLYELFAEVLHHLCHIGSAYEDDPNITLK
ncbi:MAG TPA: DUF3137 domain-containing protein [Phycisphaerae bacterium]|jgi:hypothetical protein